MVVLKNVIVGMVVMIKKMLDFNVKRFVYYNIINKEI
jgi:hypothetical protein